MIDFFKDYTWIIIVLICFGLTYKEVRKKKINNNEKNAICIGIFQGIWLIDYFSIHYFDNVFGKYNNHILGISILVQWFFVMKNAYNKIISIRNIEIKKKELRRFYFSTGYLIIIGLSTIVYVSYFKK